MSNRRFYLTVFLLLLVLSGGIFFTSLLKKEKAEQEELFPNHSIYNPKPSGYQAWHQALTLAGVTTHVWRLPFTQLKDLPSPVTMVLIGPQSYSDYSQTFSKKDILLLERWIRQGNTLIVLDTFQRKPPQSLLASLGLAPPTQRQPPIPKRLKGPSEEPTYLLTLKDSHPLLKGYLSKPLESHTLSRLDLERTTHREDPLKEEKESEDDKTDASPAAHSVVKLQQKPLTPAQLLVSDEENDPVFVQFPYGQGHVILGTAPDMGSNAYLFNTHTDNYQFLTNLLVMAAHPVYINEFVHGYGEHPDILKYYSQTPLGKVFVQVLFVFLFLLWLSYMRWKPAIPPGEQDAASPPEDFTRSLATIYYLSQASAVVLSPMINAIETTLRRRYRLELNETQRIQTLFQTLFADYSSKASPMASLQKAITLVEQDAKLPHRELLRLMQELSTLRDRLEKTAPSPSVDPTPRSVNP